MDLTALRDADPRALPDGAEAYARLTAALRTSAEEWHATVLDRTDASGWRGAAADGCRARLQQTDDRLTAAQAELGRVGAVLRSGADALQLAQARLLEALDEARTAGLTVAPDGQVSAPRPAPADRHDPDARLPQQRGSDLSQRIASALREADAADRTLAEQLQRFTRSAEDGSALIGRGYAPGGPQVGPVPDLLAAAFPPATASPGDVAAWWRSLPAAIQQHLITTRPDLVGNRDGLPAAARDQANRLLLHTYLADYGSRTHLSPADQTRLAGFRAIQDRLDRGRDIRPPLLLLGISDQGQGRGILSFGDPDTAANVSAYVPGLGTELRNVGGKDADRAYNVWKSANKADPSRPTASIVWLGYDPPPGLDKGDPASLSVASDDRARAGAASYAHFLTGLRASHDGGQPAHLTALGHSYGSLTVGLSGQRPGGNAADDVILIGSPGTEAQHASQLGVPSDHVWVGAAENDPVTRLPDPVADATGHTDERWFGRDPASSAFGGRRFDVADGPSYSFSSHSNYLDASGGNSLPNIGQIVSGHPDRVKTQSFR